MKGISMLMCQIRTAKWCLPFLQSPGERWRFTLSSISHTIISVLKPYEDPVRFQTSDIRLPR